MSRFRGSMNGTAVDTGDEDAVFLHVIVSMEPQASGSHAAHKDKAVFVVVVVDDECFAMQSNRLPDLRHPLGARQRGGGWFGRHRTASSSSGAGGSAWAMTARSAISAFCLSAIQQSHGSPKTRTAAQPALWEVTAPDRASSASLQAASRAACDFTACTNSRASASV